ncbi:Spliceosome-associated protein 49 [Taxawa tesnikishii (nom. ined.)]|nr:Spliceosome-associated protein 49 [Dothideales sp. JES 119]
MSGPGRHWEQDKEATVYVGNLDERVTDEIVWELMLQAGRIVNVHLPKDRVTQTHQGYGFVEFVSEEDADYAAKIMNQKTLEVGAELFVGNLDPMVDEKVLFETFGRFGSLTSAPKVARDDNNLSKGYGFISFTTFEASDDAIANMHGQYLMNKEITVQYAYKKDGKGERHGDAAERALAASGRKHGVEATVQPLPPQLFTAGAPSAPSAMLNGAPDGARGPTPGGYGMGAPPGGPPGGYNAVPPPQQARTQTPLQQPPRMPDCRPDHRRRKLGTAVRHKGSHRLAQLLLDSHHRQDLRLRQGSPLLAALVSVHRLALDRRRVDGRCVRS